MIGPLSVGILCDEATYITVSLYLIGCRDDTRSVSIFQSGQLAAGDEQMLDATFKALADPTRRSIIEILAVRDCSVGELVDQFDFAQSGISRHLSVLEEANLIVRRRAGQRRICSLAANPLEEAGHWIRRYREHWDASLERSEAQVAENAD